MTFEELIALPPELLLAALNNLEPVKNKLNEFVDSNQFSALTGGGHVSGWGLETWDIDKDSVEVSDSGISFDAYTQFTGESDLDSPPSGDTVSGSVSIQIDPSISVEVDYDGLELEDL